MKTEELKAKGLNEEQIAFIMAENGKDVNREKEKADNYKTQLDVARNALKEFEGVDVSALNSRIGQLTKDLADKENKYNAKIAERDFNDLVGKYAGEFRARDVRAVLPFLDVEKLKQSKNQNDDLKAAFEAVKKEKGYLFEDETIPRVVGFTSGPDQNVSNTTSKANEALRSFLGKD